MEALSDLGHWRVVGTTVAIIVTCVMLHYEVLLRANGLLARLPMRRRPRIFVLILMILLSHVAQIWLFAGGYYYLVGVAEVGTLVGLEVVRLADCVYFSAVTFTTLGFGDITPAGPIRFMVGMEALSGLVLITWSASFAFLEMQRFWRP